MSLKQVKMRLSSVCGLHVPVYDLPTTPGHAPDEVADGVYTHTVEVGSLHTLRLESLKLVFQPLHKFLSN